jgi:hypothetical protein
MGGRAMGRPAVGATPDSGAHAGARVGLAGTRTGGSLTI